MPHEVSEGLQLAERQAGHASPGAVANPAVLSEGLAKQSIDVGILASSIGEDFEVHGWAPYVASLSTKGTTIIFLCQAENKKCTWLHLKCENTANPRLPRKLPQSGTGKLR